MTRQQYIHLSWQGYLDGGLRIVAKNKKGSNAAVSFNKNIFKTVRKHVLNYAQGLRNDSIQKLETQYNQSLRDSTNKMINLIKNTKNTARVQDFFKAVAKSSHIEESIAEWIKDKIVLTEKGTFQFKNKNFNKNILPQGHGGFHVPDKHRFVSGSAQWHYIQTLQSALETLLKKLKQPGDEILENIQSLDVYHEVVDLIENDIESLKELNENAEEQNKIIKDLQINTKLKKAGGVISHKAAKDLVDAIELLLIDINSVDAIMRQINQYWAETEGALLQQHAMRYALKNLQGVTQAINQSKSVGSNKSRVSIDKGKYIVTTDVVSSLTIDEKEQLENILPAHSSALLNQNKAKLDIFRDYSVYNKADIIFDFTNLNNKKQTANISMKYTNLFSQYNTPEFDFPAVELQKDSSLLLYLAGITDLNGQLVNTDMHYLNVFAKHKDAKSNNMYNEIRKSANESLLLMMLYQTLTGAAQNRQGGTNANVLAIKDPKSGYVRFFDMYQIVKAAGIEDIEKYISTYPKISTLELENVKEKANPNEENPLRAAGLRRTQKVILKARHQNISIAISKALLQKVYQKPDIT